MRVKSIFVFLITLFVTETSINAKSILDRYNAGETPKLRQTKNTDLVSIYRYSSHARALEAQKRAYRSSAIKNAKVFSGRNAIINRTPYNTIYRKNIPLYTK